VKRIFGFLNEPPPTRHAFACECLRYCERGVVSFGASASSGKSSLPQNGRARSSIFRRIRPRITPFFGESMMVVDSERWTRLRVRNHVTQTFVSSRTRTEASLGMKMKPYAALPQATTESILLNFCSHARNGPSGRALVIHARANAGECHWV